MNWSLWANTAWDYAANTRGFTDGGVVSYVSPTWSLRIGVYRMPEVANSQKLEASLRQAREEDVELTLSPWLAGPITRLLAYRNIANMGDYREAIATAALNGGTPDISADDHPGRRKYGFAINMEQPLADAGETGVFARVGWNDGATESFAFTEVDRHFSVGAQLSGAHWSRSDDRLAIAWVLEGLSAPHREYLARGGSGFVLGDGALDYARENITEIYYRAQFTPFHTSSVKLQLSPDFQYVRNPGYNNARGPVRFWSVRAHLEY
jgi:high affinity Mn2+ porin